MKLASRFLVVVCVGIVVLVSGLSSAQKTVPGLAGTWSGRAAKQGTAKPYKVTVILDGSGGFIEYSDMKCGGTLRFVRQAGDTLSYSETITHGKANCSQDGRVEVLPSGNALAWSWFAGENKATATLSKTPASSPAGCVQCDFNYDRDFQACYRMANPTAQQKCEDQAEQDAKSCNAACKI